MSTLKTCETYDYVFLYLFQVLLSSEGEITLYVQNPTGIPDLVFRDKISLRHGKIKSKEIQILCEFTLSFADICQCSSTI